MAEQSQVSVAPQSYSVMPVETPEETGWLASAWGIVFFIILIGTGIGIFLWWIWAKSPLRLWVKIMLSVVPVVLLLALL